MAVGRSQGPVEGSCMCVCVCTQRAGKELRQQGGQLAFFCVVRQQMKRVDWRSCVLVEVLKPSQRD